MKNSEIKKRAELYTITLSSPYKMGETVELNIIRKKEIICTVKKDRREYYTGRGAKYNSSIRHGEIYKTISLSELNKWYTKLYGTKKEQTNKKRKIKENRKAEELNNCGNFYAEKGNDDVLALIYNVKHFDAEEIAAKITEISGIEVTAENVERNKYGHSNDYKTYTNINNTHYLYNPCGCNHFTLSLCVGKHEDMFA